MWDLPHLVKIKQAQGALRKGRLDEAYSIAMAEGLREYKQCQDLLEKLVAAFVKRGQEHLQADRSEDALADAGRAQEITGNRPEIAALREEALALLAAGRKEACHAREAAQSVRRHLDAGRLEVGAHRLEDLPADAAHARELHRRLERQRLLADQARQRVNALLESDDLLGAIEAARRIDEVAREEPQSRIVLSRLGETCQAAVSRAIRDGDLPRAATVLESARGLHAPGFDATHWSEVVRCWDRGARSVARGDGARARIDLARLREIEPSAKWAAQAEKRVLQIDEAVRFLSVGPLGRLSSWPGSPSGDDIAAHETIAAAAVRTPDEPDAVHAAAGDDRDTGRAAEARPARYALWVDGIGSFLLVCGQRTTLGRCGSSSDPDVALSGDLDGIHAEILRVDHDYFLVPRAAAFVAGRPVERHLLADADEIRLGARTRLKFRLPTSLSSTAALELGRGQRLAGDVRKVLLVDGHVLLGGNTACHIETPGVSGRVILTIDGDGVRCRAQEPLLVDGREEGKEVAVPLEAHIAAGSLTFTLTSVDRGGQPV